MKSLAELQAIKNKMKDKVVLRDGMEGMRVVVGMATCGIAAGVCAAPLPSIKKGRPKRPFLTRRAGARENQDPPRPGLRPA